MFTIYAFLFNIIQFNYNFEINRHSHIWLFLKKYVFFRKILCISCYNKDKELSIQQDKEIDIKSDKNEEGVFL